MLGSEWEGQVGNSHFHKEESLNVANCPSFLGLSLLPVDCLYADAVRMP